MTDRELEGFLSETQIVASRLSKTKKLILQRAWRKIFAMSTFEKTGKWRYRGHDWHSFSYEFHTHIDGGKAIKAYSRTKAFVFYIVPEDEPLHAYECRGRKLPDLSSLNQDIYVFPPDLAWTMVFTHEQPEMGPYYAESVNESLR